jgi:hypothetical protein
MTLVVYYLFKRRSASGETWSTSGVSRWITVAVTVMALLVGSLSALENWVIKKPPIGAISTQKLCSSDPGTGMPYAEEISFSPRKYLTGRTVGQGAYEAEEWKFTKQMPGVITVVTANAEGPFVTVDSCNSEWETVIYTGKLNTSEPTPVVLRVKWQQPCEDTSH